MVTIQGIRQVVEYLEACRDSHTDCVDYLEAGNTVWDWVRDCGSLEHALGTQTFHEECVDDYNEVIRFLEALDE